MAPPPVPARWAKRVDPQHGQVPSHIAGVSDKAIHRLAKSVGVERLSKLMYEEVRGVLARMLDDALEKAHENTLQSNRAMINAGDVLHALQRADMPALRPPEHGKLRRCADGNGNADDGCSVQIAVATFKNIVHERLEDLASSVSAASPIRIAAEAVRVLHLNAEEYLRRIISAANDSVRTGRGTTLLPRHLQLALRTREEDAAT
jgi:histone H3/H4